MTSHYDDKKKCRVGTMDEKQFYAESEGANGTYFRDLIKAWTKAGGDLKWGAGGVGLRGVVKSKEVGICFLAPPYGSKKDRIELSCSALRKQIGDAPCDKLTENLRRAAGDQLKGSSMISLIQPGELPPAARKAITGALTAVI